MTFGFGDIIAQRSAAEIREICVQFAIKSNWEIEHSGNAAAYAC